MNIILSYEKMWDMNLGGSDSNNEIPHWFGNFAYGLIAAVFKVCFRYRVFGREKLRAFKGKSGIVLVGNHTSFLDVVFTYAIARPQQWVRFMARESLFEGGKGLFGQIFSRVGAFPVKRDSADRSAIKRASRMLKNKEIVGIMPEGTRRGKGSKEPELHSGAAFIARMGRAPIMPHAIRNVEKIKPKGSKFIHFPRVEAVFGDPVLVSDFDFLPKDERLAACTWYVMRESFALFRECEPSEVDMRALFPHTTDYSEQFSDFTLPVRSPDELIACLEGGSKNEMKDA